MFISWNTSIAQLSENLLTDLTEYYLIPENKMQPVPTYVGYADYTGHAKYVAGIT
jgi:hypothetical protein